MAKARDLMTPAVAAVSPDSTVADVAQIMRDRNIGNVLVVDDGTLRGIVTDRDIAARVVAAGEDPRQTPIKAYMTTNVITGQPNWSVEKVAETMGKHQIRRLPIVEKGSVVGIVSLGDVALRNRDNPAVSKSLRAISEAPVVHEAKSGGRGALLPGLLLTLLAAGVAVFVKSQRGSEEQF